MPRDDHIEQIYQTLSQSNVDSERFADAYASLTVFLTTFLLRHGNPPQLAEMLGNEAAAKVVEKLEQYQRGSFSGWCCTLALNHARTWRRREKRHQKGREPMDPAELAQIAQRSLIDDSGPSLRATAHLKFFANLGEDDYALLVKRDLENMTFPQIAEELEITADAARQRYKRLRDRMRRQAGEL